MEKIKVYPDEIVHSMESMYNAKSNLQVAETVAKNDTQPIFSLEFPWGTQYLEVDKEVKKIWKGWIYGMLRQLKNDGYEELVFEYYKTQKNIEEK